MIWRILGGIVLFALVMTAIKLAIFLLVLWGLIFRTQVTLGILLLGGTFTLLSAHPALGLGMIAIIGCCALYRAMAKKKGEELLLLPPPTAN